MLRVLLKKQLAEVFKQYFFNAKKNKMRSKGAIAAWFFFFVVIMVGVLGGMFTFLSVSLCGGLTEAGVGWLYFLILCGIAIVFGAFGSVFNTYSSLYLAKDNDLLLSMPIPVRTIMAARLANVYLLGTMYAATALIPALIVYWVFAGPTVSRVLCGILLFLIVTTVVLLLSCLLGWVVAKISLKLKNKSYITVIISLAFIGAYYFFYFKANGLIRNIVANASAYGTKIKGVAYILYLFGRIGEGSWAAAAVFTAVTAVLFVLVWAGMSRSFLGIATAGGAMTKKRYVEKTVREKSAFGALLGKEFARFTSNANYMLNCGLGVLLIPATGILLLIKGREICEVIDTVLAGRPGATAVLLCSMLCLMAAMNDMAAPSVSLEGKSIWIAQSLPVPAKTVLRAKAFVQIILTGLPMAFTGLCAAVVLSAPAAVKILALALLLMYTVFSAVFSMTIGVKMPNLNWINETVPIKQGGAVTIVLFSSWGISILIGGLYMLIGYRMGAAPYLALCSAVFACLALILLHWLNTKGAREFETL